MLVLINCFKEIFSVVHEMSSLDDQPFDCLQYTLQSIDIIIKIFICQHKKDEKIHGCSRGSNKNIWDDTVASMFTTQLLEKFPINSAHHFSAKVRQWYRGFMQLQIGWYYKFTCMYETDFLYKIFHISFRILVKFIHIAEGLKLWYLSRHQTCMSYFDLLVQLYP